MSQPRAPGWRGAGAAVLRAWQRLQGTQGGPHAHLEISEAGSSQREASTQPAPGPPPKTRLENNLYPGKEETKEKLLFQAGSLWKHCCRGYSVCEKGQTLAQEQVKQWLQPRGRRPETSLNHSEAEQVFAIPQRSKGGRCPFAARWLL